MDHTTNSVPIFRPRGYPFRDFAQRHSNAPAGRTGTSIAPAAPARSSSPDFDLDDFLGESLAARRPRGTGSTVSSGHDLRAFIVQQLATLKQDFRRELEEMKKAIQDDMYSTFDHESDENDARLKAELKKLRGSIIDEVRSAIEANAASMEEELPNKIEELLSVRFDEIQDKLEGQGLQMDKAIRDIDAIKDRLEKDSEYMDECTDLLLKAAKRNLVMGNKLAAFLKSTKAAAAEQAQPGRGDQTVAERSSAPTKHHVNDQEGTSTTYEQHKEATLTPTVTNTTPGGQASFTLSATASSISFSMNTASSLPANSTTPTASLAQLRKTRQIIHDNNDGPRGSAMPPAKRPRTEEVPNG